MTSTLLRRTAAGAVRRDPKTPPADGAADPAPPQGDHVAVLLLVELAPGALTWGWSRIVLGALPLRRIPGLVFARALGSGHRGGFGLRPGLRRQGLFALFDGERAADAFIGALFALGETVLADRGEFLFDSVNPFAGEPPVHFDLLLPFTTRGRTATGTALATKVGPGAF